VDPVHGPFAALHCQFDKEPHRMSLLASLKSLLKGKEKQQGGEAPPVVKARPKKRRGVDIRTRFEIQKESTAGTMSKFYKARDRETNEIVGVKVLDREKFEAFEARFKGANKPTEGEIATSFDHPNIVRTFEYGTTNQSEPYLVMEFIDGPNFSSLVTTRDPMIEGLRVPLIRQIAEAIQAVHDAKFIHRDVCARNVMVDAENGTLKLIDFGLAVPATKLFMQPGNRTGNPNYMAPEIVKRQSTDTRVDVFAFGVTAYEICTFNLPWSRGVKGDVAMSHATQPPMEITKYRPQINPQLGKAIMSCIEPDREKRCPTLRDFLKMIQGVEAEDVG
jgi:serine/threonine-protein kinase